MSALNDLQDREAGRALHLASTALDAAWFLPAPAKAAGKGAVAQTTRVVVGFFGCVASLVADSRIVFALWERAEGWTELRAQASAVAGGLDSGHRLAGDFWQGRGAAVYSTIAPSQRNAVLRVDAVAHQVQASLTWAAEAGVVLYAGLAALLAELVGAVFAAIPLLAVPVSTIPTVAALLAAVAAIVAQFAAIMAATAAAYAWAKVHVDNIRSEGFDQSTFPGGAWPDPRTNLYADASVTDGDPSSWTPAT